MPLWVKMIMAYILELEKHFESCTFYINSNLPPNANLYPVKKKFSFTVLLTILSLVAFAQWPKEIQTKNGTTITVYQPQPESMKGNKLDGRAAFSAQEKGSSDPLFGVFWFTT